MNPGIGLMKRGLEKEKRAIIKMDSVQGTITEIKEI